VTPNGGKNSNNNNDIRSLLITPSIVISLPRQLKSFEYYEDNDAKHGVILPVLISLLKK